MSYRKKYDMDSFNIYDVEREYAPIDDVLSEDDITVQRVKKIVYTRLNETDRRIILAYAEIGNVRDTARLFRVSPTTIWLRIQEIKNKIKNYLE